MAKLDEPMVHGCGQSFTYTQSYTKHAKACDGTKPATSGRIAARGGSGSSSSSEEAKQEPRPSDPPRGRKTSAKRPTRRAKKPARSSVQRRKKRVAKTIRLRVPRTVVASVRDKALGDLRAEKAKVLSVVEKIDDAIRALEALA